MNVDPKISVLLPTFNGTQFLDLQIESILRQTDQELELLIVDDGSIDSTAFVIGKWENIDKRVRRLPSTGNLGQKVRLRQLVDEARGEFVAFADQDDVWADDRNERLLEVIGQHAVAFGRSKLIDKMGVEIGYSILEAHNVDAHSAGALQSLFLPLVSAHAALVRRSWLDVAVITGPNPFDWMFGIEAMLSTGLVYNDRAIVYHRIHESNQMNGEALSALEPSNTLISTQRKLKKERTSKLDFFLRVDQLSRSISIKPEFREKMYHAAAACRFAWFHPLDFKVNKSLKLKRALSSILQDLAKTDEELDIFKAHLDKMSRGALTPKNIASGVIDRLWPR